MTNDSSSDIDPAHHLRRSSLGIGLSAAAAALVLLLPTPAGLPAEGHRLAAIFVVAILLWATEALPVAITALVAILLQPLLGVTDMNTAIQKSASPVFFFVFAMFCIAAAVVGSGLDRRFAHWLLDRAGTDSRRVVTALMLGSAAISTIVSDVPATAIFMAIGLGILTRLELEPGKSNLGKAVMIGIPIAALIGGVATPAGSSVNILGIHFIEEFGKVEVSFVQWMALGVPMALLLLPVACWAVLRCFPPEVATLDAATGLADDRRRLGPTTVAERKTLLLIGAMMTLWILGSWVSMLSTVVVAIGGAVAMFLPGIRLLDWRQAQRAIGWDILLMIGGVTSIGAASVETGLAKWLVDVTLGGTQDWSIVWLLLAIGAFTVLIHLALPIGPVINVVVVPPIALLALGSGLNPALLALPVAFTASCAMLLPIDPVPLLTYSKGYYRMVDMFRPGWIISIVWVLWMTTLMLVVGPLVGLT